MKQYLIQQHIKKVCTPRLNDDSILECGVCPFEEFILEESPELILNFKLKRQLIREKHDDKRKNRN